MNNTIRRVSRTQNTPRPTYAKARSASWKWLLLLSLILLVGCKGKGSGDGKAPADEKENLVAKKQLQGIWVDAESGDVLFRALGDTIYYPDTTSVPVCFKIVGDTLFLNGHDNSYAIDRQTANIFWFHSQTGDIVKLEKSDDPDDSLAFVHDHPQTLTYTEVVKRDTVIMYKNKRYHAYIAVNPTHYKVYKTSYTDEGMSVQNVYYDNIIHISLYRGSDCLYSRDIHKADFKGMIPARFLSQAILSNMEVTEVDSRGTHFKATVCIPDGASCYCIAIIVSHTGEVSKELEEY
jgi:hypothetical protein